MSRMFRHVTTTWNPIVGCKHLCVYCWARRLAVTKLRHLPQYKDGFETSKLVENAFKKRFKPGEFVFVSDMGDMFGSWVPSEWILKVINYIRRFPRTTFLFLTKNPSRYHEFIDIMPENTVLGTTIETDNDMLSAEISKAPLPSERYKAMQSLDLDSSRKFVSIEPILDFDLDKFASWIIDINPGIVYVGYDNYNHRLKEPRLDKTMMLVKRLELSGIRVFIKTMRKAWYES